MDGDRLFTPAEGMKTLGLNEAAAFLRCHPEELRRRTRAGVIPGAKVGRAWVFLEDDLADFVRSLSSVPTLFEQDQLLIGNVLDVVGYGLCK